MKDIVIYTMAGCAPCVRAKALLLRKDGIVKVGFDAFTLSLPAQLDFHAFRTGRFPEFDFADPESNLPPDQR